MKPPRKNEAFASTPAVLVCGDGSKPMRARFQIWLMRALVVSAFMFSGALVYAAAHWLVWTDSVSQRVFRSPFQSVAVFAGIIHECFSLLYALSSSSIFCDNAGRSRCGICFCQNISTMFVSACEITAAARSRRQPPPGCGARNR